MTIAGVKYSSGESGAAGSRASDKELPPATLSGEIASVERESNDSVSEGRQAEREVDSIWCRNVLADHPPWAQSSSHGEEPSGEVGMHARSMGSSSGACRAGIASTENVNCLDHIWEGTDVVVDRDVEVSFEDGACGWVALAEPRGMHACPLESKLKAADAGEQATSQHPFSPCSKGSRLMRPP